MPPVIIVKFFPEYRDCLFRAADTKPVSLSCFIFFRELNLKPREGYLNDIALNRINTYHCKEIQITDLSPISEGNN